VRFHKVWPRVGVGHTDVIGERFHLIVAAARLDRRKPDRIRRPLSLPA